MIAQRARLEAKAGWILPGFDWYAAFLLGALLICSGLCHGQKTDTVTLTNGDVLTGEIKELNRGLLRYSTDSMSTIYIEWLDIRAIKSDKYFSVETANGTRAFGTLSTSEDMGGLEVSYADRTVWLEKHAVVIIMRIKDSFLNRFDGNISAGINFKKADSDLLFSLSVGSKYTTRRHIYNVSASAQVSSRSSGTGTERYVGSFSHQGYIKPKWSTLSGAELEQNTELDLKLRVLALAGGARQFINSNRTRLQLAAGPALNNERYFSVDKVDRTSWELFGTFNYEFFKFNTPKADLVFRFTVFPSLTESGRVRTTSDTKVRWEIVKDLYWNVSLYTTTDNQPPEPVSSDQTQTSGTDYGINTSLEYTF